MDVELQDIGTADGNGGTHFSGDRGPTSNGEDVTVSLPDASEGDGLLSTLTTPQNGGPASQTSTPQEETSVCRIKRELNEVVFWKVRLWMIIIFIFVLIIAVILVALAVCAAIHEDEDEKFDPSLFKLPLYHNGRFELPNQVFTDDLFNMSSNKSQFLAASLQEKVAGVYTSSPALGRYFSHASINAFRNGSVVADYHLKFLIPEEEKDWLRNFTLSREMVFNVFRQFLYDQEADPAQPLYIAPDSLRMF
ncbi:hypothetical protein fugu_010538 [Takifugu bimaculatus]|uniref:SEA domain-containing protein n=1 Tax=Takifugu bimaculatus TaxID=433685 RepID=A0A4Z2CAF7_9TELE|nr:hypothetical protein fugu_010538 [Takifugu bimaculatus]